MLLGFIVSERGIETNPEKIAAITSMAATTQVVSAAIVVERREEGHEFPIQRPVYFISEVLSETKIRYPQIQKLLYMVILTRRKL
jgi:hypothetical protein